jgi:hypothetical protein
MPDMYQRQEGCSVTTGGPDYNMVWGPSEASIDYFNCQAKEKPSKEWIERLKTGTRPVQTFFYNEPWNSATTGPAPFLSEPEVHMSGLRTMPPAKQESGSTRVRPSLENTGSILLLLCSLLLIGIAF